MVNFVHATELSQEENLNALEHAGVTSEFYKNKPSAYNGSKKEGCLAGVRGEIAATNFLLKLFEGESDYLVRQNTWRKELKDRLFINVEGVPKIGDVQIIHTPTGVSVPIEVKTVGPSTWNDGWKLMIPPAQADGYALTKAILFWCRAPNTEDGKSVEVVGWNTIEEFNQNFVLKHTRCKNRMLKSEELMRTCADELKKHVIDRINGDIQRVTSAK
jgi:hypothetical protein